MFDDIHRELHYDTHEADLRNLKGVWNTLQSLRSKATTPAGVAAYRSYLSRCIRQLETVDAELNDHQFGVILGQWSDLHRDRTIDLIEQAASRQPIGVENWCAKWLPDVYEDYRQALNAWLERATQRTGNRLLETTRTMFDRFEKAITE